MVPLTGRREQQRLIRVIAKSKLETLVGRQCEAIVCNVAYTT
jgi:hypothetical protein